MNISLLILSERWAHRLMSKHNNDREKAINNIPERFSKELQQEIAEDIEGLNAWVLFNIKYKDDINAGWGG